MRKSQRTRTQMIVAVMVAGVTAIPWAAAADGPIRVPRVTIRLVNECEIPALDAGMLAKVSVHDGQAVSRNEVIAVLENEQQSLNLKAAEFNLKVANLKAVDQLGVQSATAQLEEARSGRQVKEVALLIATAEAESNIAVQVATADKKLRTLELERAQSARDSFKGSISKAQLDRLKTAVNKGELEIEQAQDEHRVRKLKPQAEQAAIKQTDEQVHRFEALVQQEQKVLVVAKVSEQIHANDLAMAQLKLEYRNVRAPFDGVIAAVERQTGEWVEPGAPVARIIDLHTLRAEGFLPAEHAFADLVGKPVQIQLSSTAENNVVRGQVTFVSSEIDPVNKQVRFRAEFDNSKMIARPGMNASLIIE